MNASGMVFKKPSEDIANANETPKPAMSPLKPDPKLTLTNNARTSNSKSAKTRPQKLFFTNPLSPIASSPENSPPGTPTMGKHKQLSVPSFLKSFLSNKDLNSSSVLENSRY